uniref:HAT C-terminal dimerisation domain-containing protein n=1 Tax=Tetradesmus obliquus TaxID=3088 RepID=A0A383W2G9_TETOB
MSEQQQQQQAGGQVQNAGPARIGLARSRHALDAEDPSISKKPRGAAPSFAHNEISTVNGQKRCNHCNMSVPGNITRVKTHLLTCQKFLTSEAAQKVAESNQEVAAKLKALKEKRGGQTTLTGLPVGAGGSGAGSSAGSCSSTGAGRSASAFPVKVYPKYSAADIEEHNEAIAIFLYGCNQPLSLVEHPDFQQMVFTLAPHMKGKLIGRKALATTMLDKVYEKTQSKVEGFLQEQKYVATSTDAWSSSHNAGAHVLNVNAITNGTSVFLDMVESVLGKWNILDKTVAFVTDWGSNMVKAGECLQEMLPHYAGGVNCLQHLISNGLKDFAKNESVASIMAKGKEVVQYLTGRTVPRAIYDEKKQQLGGTALVKAGTTRFGSNVLSMESVERNEKVLRATVSSDKFDSFIQSQSKATDKEAAIKFKGLINGTSSVLFSDIKWAVDTLAPFQSAIKEVEGDTAKLSDGYYAVQALTKHVEKISAAQGSYLNMMQDDDTPAQTLALAFDFATSGFAEAWDTRAKQATTDLVVAAAIVDPRYKDKLSSMPAADVVRGEALIEQLAGRMMGQQAQTKAKGQLMNYKSRPREIGITPAAVAATQTAGVAPETFWTDISHSCAELSEVARMLLSIPPSSATSERVFSAVSQVWDTGRSCMASARVRKLLFIYFNRKALSRTWFCCLL